MKEIKPSEVFKMFENGYSPVGVVLETDADPSQVKQWFRDWLDMQSDWGKFKFGQLERDARERLGELKELLGADAIKLQGKKPSGLLAAMVWLMAKEREYNLSQVRVADIYEITEVTVYESRKLLEELMQGLGLKLGRETEAQET